MAARHEQVGKCAGNEQAMSVLVQPAVADHDEAEYPLDDVEGMLDFGSHLGLGAVPGPLGLVNDAAMTVALIGEVESVGCLRPDQVGLATVGLIAPHSGFLAMQEGSQHLAVGNIGGSGDHGVNELGLAVDANMGLHAEVPLPFLV